MDYSKSQGFAHVHLFIVVIVVAAIGAVGWRVVSVQKGRENSQASRQSATGTQSKLDSNNKTQDGLASEKTDGGNNAASVANTAVVSTSQTAPSGPVDNSTKGAVVQTQKVTTPAPASTPSPTATTTAPSAPTTPSPTVTVLRPTAEFCAQKNGAPFTNVWLTGTESYTYDGYAWEGGYGATMPMTTKTESGTPVRNFDTMRIFDVLPYGTQPKWAICSSKTGYVTVYYSVPGSSNVFNVLAEYGHLSLQQP